MTERKTHTDGRAERRRRVMASGGDTFDGATRGLPFLGLGLVVFWGMFALLLFLMLGGGL